MDFRIVVAFTVLFVVGTYAAYRFQRTWWV